MSCELKIRQFDQSEWNQLIAESPDLCLQQLWQYGEAKQQIGSWQTVRMVFLQNEKIVGAAQAALRLIPIINMGLIWLSRAPLILDTETENKDLLTAQILEQLKKYWVDQKRLYLRIAPSFSFSAANEQLVKKLGYKMTTKNQGWTSYKLDLSLTLEVLESQFRKNWRQCLKKSQDLGVKVTSNGTDEIMRTFISDLESLIENKKLKTSATPTLIKAIYDFSRNENTLQIYSADVDGRHLGSIIIAYYGKTGFYLAGAVNEEGRRSGANHNLLWHAVTMAKSSGYRWFDVGGAHPINTPPGILYFKQGLGGQQYQLFPEIEAYSPGLVYKLLNRIISNKR